MNNEVRWVEPHEGFELTPHTVAIDAAEQIEKLDVCGLPNNHFDGAVDASFFIRLGIHAGIASGISAEGNINMVQSLIQYRPVRLGEPLTVRGAVTKVETVPRGQAVETDVWFEDESGAKAVSAWRRSLRPIATAADSRGAGARPAPVVSDAGELVERATHQLTPAAVKGYSSEGNSIHYEMGAANRAGFRAPMIGGGMGVHYLLAALWSDYRPTSFNLDIYFRRPIFWDDAFGVSIAADASAMCTWRRDADAMKVLTEARINSLS
ncbi:MAG: hypothetical protein K0U93_24900 [Gammaproteobacteria bacterium]|nr:hypothetical protein [Gammaproteobacteria bacterium]